MSLAKISGWVLLLLGLAIIGYSLYSSYNIFTAKESAPEVFKVKPIEISVPESAVRDLQAQMEEVLEKQLQDMLGQMLPTGSIPKLLNLISWSIFASILIFAGSKIAGLGIRLIRKH